MGQKLVLKRLSNIGWISYHGEGLRNGIFPAIPVNKNVTVISHCSSMWVPEPQGHLGKRRIPVIWQPSDAATPYDEPQGSSGCEQHKILARIAEMYDERNDFSEPRFFASSHIRKTLNSLTWDIWLPSISNSLLMFRLHALCCKTSILPGSSPHFLGAVLSGLLEMLSPGLEALKISTE